MWTVISEAKNWEAIQDHLISIKNIMELRGLDEYDQYCWILIKMVFLHAQQSVNDMFKFLKANREDPTSIENV